MTAWPRLPAALAALLAAVLLPACATGGGATAPLEPSAWILSSLPGRDTPPSAGATLRFERGRASGSDGCNRFSGPYAAVDGRLSFGPNLAATQMACPEPLRGFAAAFGQALARTATYRVDAGALVLLDAQGATLASFSAQPTRLVGTRWQVTGYNTGTQAVSSVAAGTRITLEFADGGVRGSGGCNGYSGTFTEGPGGALAFGPLRTTRMACPQPPETMPQEAAFLRALQTVASARREGNRLELRTADGALAVSATASP
jgi:heat shock protein HslJ